MLYAYILLAVLTIAVIVFIALTLKWLAYRVTSSIRERSIELIGTYDELLSKKSGELERLNREIREKESLLKAGAAQEEAELVAAGQNGNGEEGSQYTVLNAVERAGTARSRDKATAGIYRTIRGNFCYEPEEVLDSVSAEMSGRREGVATAVLRELDYGMIFKLSTLPSEEQYRILYESVFDDAVPLLEEYMGLHDTFDSIGFYDFLKMKASAEAAPLKVIVPEGSGDISFGDHVDVEEDSQIVEGFLVEADNVVYDYSIRESEII